jgi:hypothetical protein
VTQDFDGDAVRYEGDRPVALSDEGNAPGP